MYKDKHFTTQYKQVRAAMSSAPKTMLQVSIETGILRANICRYVRDLKKYNAIRLTHFGLCPISKHRAGFYTTNLNSNQNYGRG